MTQSSKRKGRRILNLFSNEELKKVDVKISETGYPFFINRRGTLGFLNATMSYSEDILIFTEIEKSSFGEINNTLPLVIQCENIKSITIKSDEYILYIGNSILEKKIQIYSDKENDLLKIIFNDLKNIISKS